MRQLIAVISFFVLSACSPQAPASSPESVCQSKGYSYSADGLCSFEQEGSATQPQILIQYPLQMVLRSPLIESTIDTYIAEYRATFMEEFEAASHEDGSIWSFELRPTGYQHSENIVSLQFTESFYMGGAHPGLSYRCYTFDTAANQILNFPDLFVEGSDPLAVIAPIARREIQSSMFGMAIPEEVERGTDELSEFADFALTDTNLILFFETGQVAAQAAGPQEVQIPLSDLAGILRDF